MTAEARIVDVTYRGLKVAKGAKLIPGEGGTAFVEIEAPLPVGTRLQIVGDEHASLVVAVVEQEAGAKNVAGMKVAWDIPAPPPAAAPPEPEPEPDAGDSASMSSQPDGTGEGKRRRRRKNAPKS